MTRLMLKEEQELRKYLSNVYQMDKTSEVYPLITALVRACYEDAAKVADDWDYNHGSEQQPWSYGDKIAAAIRRRK